ncbi:S1C family serine protease [Tessaracoccus sp. OH4464_COT-324]|uniref:S1C family serine protease n=1 Tax=Tessaracoccus sp. OH4464_COT-324 TaxID=2491059 RepID=UPI000F63B12D|nr:trypsin-like peptidase domain-containing protein [Tessaracoccus sp. OH4464_COT-324]RRD47151.1 PDZ domain-containing protein [Tessaracoccus sp. OH4464_COT-324]
MTDNNSWLLPPARGPLGPAKPLDPGWQIPGTQPPTGPVFPESSRMEAPAAGANSLGDAVPPPAPAQLAASRTAKQARQWATFQQAPQGQPMLNQPLQPQPRLLAPPPRRGNASKVAAAVVGVILLAAGAGAGSAALTTRYLMPGSASSGTTISAEGQPAGQSNPSDPDWTAVADSTSKSVVAIQAVGPSGGGSGSGVVLDAEGNIVTNNHVVNGATALLVSLGEQNYEARLVGTDPTTDLAVIRIVNPPNELQPITWGDGNALRVGDPVMAIGNPLGLSDTVTTGIVSALDRPVTTELVDSGRRSTTSTGEVVVTAAIQTSAAINPGNSGGALLNASGQLVGITSSIASVSSDGQQSGNIGIGFAIGSQQTRNVVDQLLIDGDAEHPLLGVKATDTRVIGPQGAKLDLVLPNSPAGRAGLQPGDVITSVAGRKVSSRDQLIGLVRAQKIGETIPLTYRRGDTEQQAQVEMHAG